MDLNSLLTTPRWKELLIKSIEKEELDPWQLDIERLAKAFREEIEKNFTGLEVPANVILAYSIILKYKSYTLDRFLIREEEISIVPEEIIEIAEEVQVVIRRRPYTRAISLDMLIDEIEKAMKKYRERKVKEIVEEIEPFIPTDSFSVEEYGKLILEEIEKLADENGVVEMSLIVRKKTWEETVKRFITLVFLWGAGVVEIEKREGEYLIKYAETQKVEISSV